MDDQQKRPDDEQRSSSGDGFDSSEWLLDQFGGRARDADEGDGADRVDAVGPTSGSGSGSGSGKPFSWNLRPGAGTDPLASGGGDARESQSAAEPTAPRPEEPAEGLDGEEPPEPAATEPASHPGVIPGLPLPGSEPGLPLTGATEPDVPVAPPPSDAGREASETRRRRDNAFLRPDPLAGVEGDAADDEAEFSSERGEVPPPRPASLPHAVPPGEDAGLENSGGQNAVEPGTDAAGAPPGPHPATDQQRTTGQYPTTDQHPTTGSHPVTDPFSVILPPDFFDETGETPAVPGGRRRKPRTSDDEEPPVLLEARYFSEPHETSGHELPSPSELAAAEGEGQPAADAAALSTSATDATEPRHGADQTDQPTRAIERPEQAREPETPEQATRAIGVPPNDDLRSPAHRPHRPRSMATSDEAGTGGHLGSAGGAAAGAAAAPAEPAAPGTARRSGRRTAGGVSGTGAPPRRRASSPSGAASAGRYRTLIWVASGVAAVIVIIGLFVLGTRLPAMLAAAPSPTPTSTDRPTPTKEGTAAPVPTGPQAVGTYRWNLLRGGECLQPYTSPWANDFTVVDCATPHAAQLVYRGTFPGADQTGFPGADKLKAQIGVLCTAPGVINMDAAGTVDDLQFQGTYPVTAEQWADGEHSYYCFVSRSSGQPMVGSVAGPGPAAG